MKKLILSAAILLGTVTVASAQTETTTTKTKTETTQTAVAQDYKEIKLEALPAAIKTAVEKSYPKAVINNAYVNDKNEYKLNLTVGDQTGVVYSDAAGNWIKK